MQRTKTDIINTICSQKSGGGYYTSNLENGEWSYPKALKEAHKTIEPAKVSSVKSGRIHSFLDIRFEDKVRRISILVELKNNADHWDKKEIEQQLQAYVEYEKVLTGNKIIAIIANTEDERVWVWWGSDLKIDDAHKRTNQFEILSFDEYADLYLGRKNNKQKVIRSTYTLNEKLHGYGIPEKRRSQFVGTCLLCLKNGLLFKDQPTKSIIGGMFDILENLLVKDLNKAEKLVALKGVLEDQKIEELPKENFADILVFIQNNILPFINEKSTLGQDLLNLFFTTFNKYVGKDDKNQAFTPDHIVHFMCRVVGVNRNSVVLDPCCGSGAFLVRAMTEALDDCSTKEEKEEVKSNHIFGIEKYKDVFGLASTNMLIHGDGRSNVRQGDCFQLGDWIEGKKINTVLMNPPYNATLRDCNPEYQSKWSEKKEDPSKGFHFVHYVASKVKTGKLAVLLPVQCAIGSSKELSEFKRKMLAEHTLDAVFTLPPDMFHPGASANACCMVFNLGVRHEKAPIKATFFGYFKEDGFIKRKNLGRVERTKPGSGEGVWADIESEWLDLYNNRKSVAGKSVTKVVTADDEWLCEAYMETDYSALKDEDFEKTVRDYVAYKIANESPEAGNRINKIDSSSWGEFKIGDLFRLEFGKVSKAGELPEGNDILYVGAKKGGNGIMERVGAVKNLKSEGNCLVFICDGQGSVGYVNYMDQDFLGTVNLTLGYSENLNQYTGLFIATVASLERPRYSYGRKWRGKVSDTIIKLPAIKAEDGELKPDWDFMENFIKSLHYGDSL